MEKTFLFYDLETSGLNKTFDQVLQFAAIRTDLSLNELERTEIWVRLSADIIPAPAALLTHRIPLQQMLSQGLPEITAIQQIHQLLNTPDTISIGYNNLNFDDEFLRFSFYRNLLTPYTHQYANGCSRADLYPMLIFYYLYKNEILQWPKIDNKISFKLEQLNAVNELTAGQAHHALFDVEATLALAKICREQTEIWNYLLHFFDKLKSTESLAKLHSPLANHHKEALLISPQLGFSNNYQSAVLLLGQHRHYKNKLVWLGLDKGHFLEVTSENVDEKTYSHFCKPGEDNFVLPLQSRYNRLSDEQKNLLEQNKSLLIQRPDLLKTITDYHLEYKYPAIPHLDPAAALYDIGFFTDYENFLCREFHKAAPSQQAFVIEKFTNPILRELAIRIVGRHYPEHLPDPYKEIYTNYLKTNHSTHEENILVNYRGEKKLTVAKTLQEIETYKNLALDLQQQTLLTELEKYLKS